MYEDCEVVVEKFRLWSQEVLAAGDAWGNVDCEEVVGLGREVLGSVGSRRAMLRVSGPGEGDDRKRQT